MTAGVVSVVSAVNSVLGIPDVATVVVGSSLVKSTDLDVTFVVDSVGSVFNSVDSPLVMRAELLFFLLNSVVICS